MATHSSILPWEIPWTEELDGLLSMGSQKVRHDRVTEQQQLPCPGCFAQDVKSLSKEL